MSDASRLKIVDPITLEGVPIPERRWIVTDWVPWGTVTGFYGDGGLGKSLLVQQLMTCTAIGRPWLGISTAPVRSIGFFCEDSKEELHRRQADINRLYGCAFGDLENMRWVPRLGDDNLLMRFEGGSGLLTPFHEQVVFEAKEFGAQLCIVDTVADTFGGNENSRTEVRQFISTALGRIAREIDGAVIACAHPSRAGLASGEGDSGSTGWSNAFRSRAFLHHPQPEEGDAPDANARVLARKKANYAAREDQVRLRWSEGAFITENSATGILGTIERKAVERVFLELLDAVTTEGRAVTASRNAGNFAPRLFASRPDRDGYKRADFARAMEALFAQRIITTAEYGRKGDERRKIVRATDAAPSREADSASP